MNTFTYQQLSYLYIVKIMSWCLLTGWQVCSGTNTVPFTEAAQDILIESMAWGKQVTLGHSMMVIPHPLDRRPIQDVFVDTYEGYFVESKYIRTCMTND
jgi:hypothetical protein